MASRQDVRRFRQGMTDAERSAERALQAVVEADGQAPAAAAAADLLDRLGFGGVALGSVGVEDEALRGVFAVGTGPVARAAEAYAAAGLAAQDAALRRFVDVWRVTDLTPMLAAERRSAPAENLLAHGVRAAALLPLTRSAAGRVAAVLAGTPGEDGPAFARRLRERGWLARLALLALADRIDDTARRAEPGLTAAERAVLRQVARGMRPNEIAASLGKSERTVRAQIDSARERLAARTNAQAVAEAIRRGLILP